MSGSKDVMKKVNKMVSESTWNSVAPWDALAQDFNYEKWKLQSEAWKKVTLSIFEPETGPISASLGEEPNVDLSQIESDLSALPKLEEPTGDDHWSHPSSDQFKVSDLKITSGLSTASSLASALSKMQKPQMDKPTPVVTQVEATGKGALKEVVADAMYAAMVSIITQQLDIGNETIIIRLTMEKEEPF